MNKYKCLCCGHRTLESQGDYEICPVCFWEDDPFLHPSIQDQERSLEHPDTPAGNYLDIPSGPNHDLTLRQGQENYKSFGACEKEMLEYVRKPFADE